MPRIFSGALKSSLISVNNVDVPIYLLEISHPALAVPVRICNDNEDIVSNGNIYRACPFNITFPNDSDSEVPRAQLELDNVGRQLVTWIEQTNGAEGTTVTMKLIQKSNPDLIESDIELSFSSINVTPLKISGTVGYERLLNARSVNQTYNADDFKGLF